MIPTLKIKSNINRINISIHRHNDVANSLGPFFLFLKSILFNAVYSFIKLYFCNNTLKPIAPDCNIYYPVEILSYIMLIIYITPFLLLINNLI